MMSFGTNPIPDWDDLSPDNRLSEIALILATGIRRMLQSRPRICQEPSAKLAISHEEIGLDLSNGFRPDPLARVNGSRQTEQGDGA